MEVSRLSFLTLAAALFFLGMVAVKPGTSLLNLREYRECKLVKGKMDCFSKFQNTRMSHSSIWYKFD